MTASTCSSPAPELVDPDFRSAKFIRRPADFRSRAARLPRQHQPRVRRRLLDRACRNAKSGDGRGDELSQTRSRRRMAKRVPPTNWLFGNLNIGGVLKIDGQGKICDALWDKPDGPLSMITSMREHKGALYLGGVTNNKIGRLVLERATLLGPAPAATGRKREHVLPEARKRNAGDAIGRRARPPVAGSTMPTHLSSPSPDFICVNRDGHLLVSSGSRRAADTRLGASARKLGKFRCAGIGACRQRGRAGRDRSCRRSPCC